MAKNGQTPQKPARKSPLAVRIALYVALVLVIICAVQWFLLKRDLQRGIALYDAGKYQEASDVLQPLMDRTLAQIRIRREAQRTLGLCKAEIATQIAMKNPSVEGWRKAIALLEEAKTLAGATPEIEKGIKEYTGYIQKSEHPETPASAPPTPPGAPPATPPPPGAAAPSAPPPATK